MRCILLGIGSFLLTLSVHAAEIEDACNLAKWQEVAVPAETDWAERMVWDYASNYSKHTWKVFRDGQRACADLITDRADHRKERPTFTPYADGFRGASEFMAVEDGWLIGFNHGEFGGALYWFSRDGAQKYKLSDDQVVQFFSLSDGPYAVAGLAHLGISEGSMLRLTRVPGPKADGRWQATRLFELPAAPYAISVRSDETLLITLSDALVSARKDGEIHVLLPTAPWSGLYPTSSVLAADEHKLYIGMRQFVGEFDLRDRTLRLLVPSARFLNKLSERHEQQIREQARRICCGS